MSPTAQSRQWCKRSSQAQARRDKPLPVYLVGRSADLHLVVGHRNGLNPATHPLSITQTTELARRIKKNHDQLAPSYFCLHHKGITGFRDVAGFLQANIPLD